MTSRLEPFSELEKLVDESSRGGPVAHRDLQLVCGRPCAYRYGSILPWPPELPGTENFSTGDLPTICAYLEALGERLAQAEEKISRIEREQESLGHWGPVQEAL